MLKLETASDFHEVYQTYNRLIKSIVFRMLGESYVDDVLQDCFVQAWKHKKSFSSKEELKNWLCRITMNLCIDNIRKAKVRKNTHNSDDIDTYTKEESPKSDLSDLILEGMKTLKNDFKSAFVLVAIEGFSTKEASVILDTKEATVRTRVHRARTDLKKFLEVKGVSYE